MQTSSSVNSVPAISALEAPFETSVAKKIFFDLFDGQACACELESAAGYLSEQINQAASLPSDLPAEMDGLYAWMEHHTESVGKSYREYLEARQAGNPRRYFETKSHALYFLKSVAPTKLVDGAWLYGLLERWQDVRFSALIKTYLEELGEGLPAKNHVVLYKKLLAVQGCEHFDDLSDNHFIQGAIQLALAYHAPRFLPEVIGFNLGYEQLPLHLLITAYELKELGIDPYYFTLHITVDNSDSGHAKKAVDAIFEALPKLGDTDEFYRRVCNGYKLNSLGASTTSVISDFDLEAEMIEIFQRKSVVGQFAHSDYRQVSNCTVNDWLSRPEETSDFIAAMEREGWFKRHEDPQNSRFWKLIQGEKARMFGVFSAYEQQVIYDWIAGNAAQEKFAKVAGASHLSPEAKHRLLDAVQAHTTQAPKVGADDFDAEVRILEQNLTSATGPEDAMSKLIALMSPANHHTAPGLMATRIFNDVLG
ncbi:Iron-containing redox enzyme [Abditibacterium utsteinense]|uniref:Iron-containing redox enzyme n=1 Tax=Abditibacterium utsteinense TaxID=1960156 RepID=A0A2S8SRZ2_9BACT|nr:iron-containing redox enzyme family protein [Abditibacterium utsteinense]PQV63555.1 Iron-containing redox enzyme [Abditibacterium utsteinense]